MNFLRRTNLVLNFHTVTSSDLFKKILSTIGSYYSFISAQDVEDFYYSGKQLEGCCHITFDDGENSFYEKAYPVLQDLKIPATLFVSPFIIENRSNYWFQEFEFIRKSVDEQELKNVIKKKVKNVHNSVLDNISIKAILKLLDYNTILEFIEEVKSTYNLKIQNSFNINNEKLLELHRSGLLTIGAHTIHHPILANESDNSAKKEISESVEMLSVMLGEKVKYFAYPNGIEGMDFTKREQEILSSSGIKLAFTTNSAYFNKSNNPLAVPRGSFECDNESKMRIITKLMLMQHWDKIRIRKEVKERLLIKEILKS